MTVQDAAYIDGFSKAAETAGVSPVALAEFSKRAGSTPLGEWAAGIPGNMLLGDAAPVVGLGAYIAGLVSDPDNRQKKLGVNFIPGVSSYSAGNRIKTQVSRELEDIRKSKGDEDASPVAHAVAEHVGSGTSIAASGLVGALAGALASRRRKDRGKWALRGALAGTGVGTLAHLGAILAAGANRRRTKKEQIESDKSSTIPKYLVPGLAEYGYAKRLGRSQGERDEDPKNGKSRDKSKEKKASALLKSAARRSWLNDVFDAYDELDPMRRRAVMGGLATGLGTYLMSDGDVGARLLKALAGGAVGGASIYGLDSAGLTDAGIDLLRSGLLKLKTPEYSRYTGLHHRGQFRS